MANKFQMPQQRLSKLMSQRGLCSRREADRFIEQGWVKVDGERAVLGVKVAEDAEIELLPQAEKTQSQLMTVILNKPVGYVSTQAEHDHRPATTLIRPENYWGKPKATTAIQRGGKKPLAAAGRLDIDSQGLLVLTQDGRVAKRLIGENSDVEKEYLIWVDQPLSDKQLDQLRHGLALDGKPLKPAKIKRLDEKHIKMTLKEGKKRQIRRMCELVGAKVTRLLRVRIGGVRLGKLPPGKWRFLAAEERF